MILDKRGGHNRKRVNSDFFTVWSSKMAYVLGLIYADGAVEDCGVSTRTCYTQITSKDKELLDDVKEVMGSTHNLYLKPEMVNIIKGKQYLCKPTYNLRIGSRKIYQDLTGYGLIPRKSLIIEFPDIPKIYLSYFIRGYFDGDGCVNVYKEV